MRDNDGRKYGRLALHRGGFSRQPAPSISHPAILELNDRIRARFAACRSVRGTLPSRAVREILEGNQKPLSSAGKRALELLAAGVPVGAVQVACALELSAWIAEQAERQPTPPPTTAALRSAA